MNDFVEQCRREWKRLGVPDPLAEEMAADLGSDLVEAEAEGVAAEELLGSSAADPRSFAASWAAERGIIPSPRGRATRRRPLALVLFTAVAAVALVVATLLLLTGEPTVSVATVGRPRSPLPSPPGGRRVPLHASAAAPIEWLLLVLAIIALGFAAWLWSSSDRSRRPNVPA